MSWFRRPVAIDTKADHSPHRGRPRGGEPLRDRLRAQFPARLLGEEFGAEGRGDAPTWVIDPIDGTRSHHWLAGLGHPAGADPGRQPSPRHPVHARPWRDVEAARGLGCRFTGRDG